MKKIYLFALLSTGFSQAQLSFSTARSLSDPRQFLSDYDVVVLADFNNDGLDDLIVCGDNQTYMTLYRNSNADFTGRQAAFPVTGQSYITDIKAADLDMDGLQDIVFTDYSGQVAWCKNNDNFSFSAKQIINTEIAQPFRFIVEDVDANGANDIVVAQYDGTITLLAGNGNGTLQSPTTLTSLQSPSDRWHSPTSMVTAQRTCFGADRTKPYTLLIDPETVFPLQFS